MSTLRGKENGVENNGDPQREERKGQGTRGGQEPVGTEGRE